jgi:hypothetical protein
MHLTAVNPVTWLIDQFRSASSAVNSISDDAARYAERLLTSNSSRVVFDLRDRLSESRRALESELRFILKEISATATRALSQARKIRDQGEIAIARELRRLEKHCATARTLAGDDAPRGNPDA